MLCKWHNSKYLWINEYIILIIKHEQNIRMSRPYLRGQVWKPQLSCRAAEKADPELSFFCISSNEFKILISFNLILPYM